MLKKLNLFLSFKQKIKLTILLIIFFINSILEVISIGSIPIFIGYLLNPETFVNNIPFDSIKHYVNFFVIDKDQKTIILFGSILIITIFLIKNLYFFLAYYFEVKLDKDIILRINTRLFNYYLNAPTKHIYQQIHQLY